MPNSCWNEIRLSASEDMIQFLLDNNFSFEKLYPLVNMEDAMDMWGTNSEHYDYMVEQKGKRGLVINFTTNWTPPLKLFNHIITKYNDIWLKCNWKSEDGMAGIYIGLWNNEQLDVKEMTWNDWSLEEENYIMESCESRDSSSIYSEESNTPASTTSASHYSEDENETSSSKSSDSNNSN